MSTASGVVAPACPDEDELVRMVEGALGEASLSRLESHVDHCERCATVIAGLGALAGGGAAPEPRRIGRYQLDRRIACGGMGEVWAAWDPQLHREIAVKLVRPDRLADDSERARLLREARALARVAHPNVLAVHDVGEIDGEVFIATELVAGDTLASRAGASADWRVLVGLYAQAARGLAAAHACGLVHRDVKPANLLLGTDGRVRVADFGLAVRSRTPVVDASSSEPSQDGVGSVTRRGFIAGTPAYMAPEQRAGAPADARVDQYALCVALAEAIAGRRPPSEIDRDALVAFVLERRAPEPALTELCGVIARGLSTAPASRFPDANALAAALEAIVPGTASVPGGGLPGGGLPGKGLPGGGDLETVVPAPIRRTIAQRIGPLVIGALAVVIIVGVVMLAVRESPSAPSAASMSPGIADGSVEPAVHAGAGIDGAAAPQATATPLVAATSPTPPAAPRRSPAPRSPAMTTPATTPTATPNPTPAATPNPTPATTPNPTPATTPATTPAATPNPSAQAALDLAIAAIRRHDGKGCRAVLAQLPPTLPVWREDQLATDLHGKCEMIAGNCDGGLRIITDRFPLPPA
ncbi:MAG: Serine/threonine-protein kinase pkn3, partial [Deltaproteobacteria bacterium]|nr:Serine/threonine-protein kinase pkn3 [Deltaproteobacteria bacterium]